MNSMTPMPIHQFDDEGVEVMAVNGRDLHHFLAIRRDFPTWIAEMIRSFEFAEGADFTKVVSIPKNGEQTYQGVKTRIDYFLTLDMAKELSMVQRNERGKQARQYFIECERRAKQVVAPPSLPDMSDPVVLRAYLLENIDKRIEAEQRAVVAEAKVEEAKPKTQFFDRYVNAEGLYGLQNAGRIIGDGPNKFVSRLKAGYLHYQGGALVPKAVYRDMGLFEVKATMVDDKARYQTYVTPKGLDYFAKKFKLTPPANLGGIHPTSDQGALL